MATWLPEPTPNQDPFSPEPIARAPSTSHYATSAYSVASARSHSQSHTESHSQSREQLYRHSNQPRGRPTSRPRSRSRSKSGRKGGSSSSTSGAPADCSSSVPGVPSTCVDHVETASSSAGESERAAGVGAGSGSGEFTIARFGQRDALARREGVPDGRECATLREGSGGRGGGSRESGREESTRPCCTWNREAVGERRRGECGDGASAGSSMRKQAASAGDVQAGGGVRRSSDGAMADLDGRSPIRGQRLKETMSDATHLAKTRTGSSAPGALPAHKGGITRGRFQVIEGDQSDSDPDVAPWPSASNPPGKPDAAPGTPSSAPPGSSGPLLPPSPFTAAAATATSAAHAAAAAAAAAGSSGSGGAAMPVAPRGSKEGTPVAGERRRVSATGSTSSSSSPYYSPSSHSPTAPHPASDLRHGPLPAFAGVLRFDGSSAGAAAAAAAGSWRGTGGSSGSSSGMEAGQRSTGSGGSMVDAGQYTSSSEGQGKEGQKPGSSSSSGSGSAGGRGGRGAWERGSGAEAGEGLCPSEGQARGEQERVVEEWVGKESVRHDGWAGARDAGVPREGVAGRDGAGAGGRPKARSEPLVGEKAAAAAGVGGGRRSAHADMADRSQQDEGVTVAGSTASGGLRVKAAGSMVSRSAPLTQPQTPTSTTAAAASGTPKKGSDSLERWKERGVREERGREERGREERGREERSVFERETEGRRAGVVEKDRKSGGREREGRKSDDKGKERAVDERSGKMEGREGWGSKEGQEMRRKEDKIGKEGVRSGRSREDRGREESRKEEKGAEDGGREGRLAREKGKEEEKGRQEREARGQAHGRGVARVGVQRRGRFSVTTDDVDAQDGAPATVMCTSSMHRPHPQAARLLPPAVLFVRPPAALHPAAVAVAPPLLPVRRISTHQATSRPPLPAPAPLLPSPAAALPCSSSSPALPTALVADALLLVPHLRSLLQHSCEQQEVLFNLIKDLAAAHPVVSAAQQRPVVVSGMQIKLPTDKEQVLMLKIAEMQCKVAKLVDNVLTYRNRNTQLLKQVEVFKQRQKDRKRLMALGAAAHGQS